MINTYTENALLNHLFRGQKKRAALLHPRNGRTQAGS